MISNSQKRAKSKYTKKTYNSITIRARKDDSDFQPIDIKAAAEAAGESLNTFIIESVKSRMSASVPIKPGAGD